MLSIKTAVTRGCKLRHLDSTRACYLSEKGAGSGVFLESVRRKLLSDLF